MRNRARRSLTRRLLRLLAGLLILLLIAAAAGAAWQAWAERRDAQVFPPPGRLLDIGGHRLHLHCAGNGTPTVWLEAGLGNETAHWSAVFDALAMRQRTCAYDRAGFGHSEPGPLPRSAERVLDEALRLLRASGEAPPYLLVGHSNGGAYVRLMAAAVPEQVEGLLLVDPSQTPADGCPPLPAPMRLSYGALVTLAPTGLPRALLPLLFPLDNSPLSPAAREVHAANRARAGALGALWSEVEQSCAMQASADAAGWVPGLPVEVLLSSRRPAQQDWVPEAAQAMAAGAGGKLVPIENSGHWIQLDQPQAVIDAVERLKQAAAARRSQAATVDAGGM
ncbi:MAG: alpha/beta hydrolase [Aquimonas sp.]|nr:alpha/beta hydrolase [Aquimonas sp.]